MDRDRNIDTSNDLWLPSPYLPVAISLAFQVFPADVSRLMPEYSAIPDNFKRDRTPWNKIAAAWFFRGLNPQTRFYPKPGIAEPVARRHLACILRSYQPRHEHREAAVAFLLSQWFERIENWEIPGQ